MGVMVLYHRGRVKRKRVFGHMRKPRSACASGQRLQASGPLLSADGVHVIEHYTVYKWRDFAHARDIYESVHFAHVRIYIFCSTWPM